jgi:hypothetical protein
MARTWLILAAGLLASTRPVHGHHAFSAYYFEDQSVAVEGELVEFAYQNPHSWVHIDARDNSGEIRRVSAEWSNPNRLKASGITRDTLKPGDRVIITGSPSRDQSEARMHLKRIERPADGWKWVGRDQKL